MGNTGRQMNKISDHFHRSEFKCACPCDKDTVDIELIDILEDLRTYFRTEVVVTSGYRCKEYNEGVGGSKNSKHTEGRAADIQVRGIAPTKIYNYLTNKYPDQYGFGNGRSFTHVDSRIIKARWSY